MKTILITLLVAMLPILELRGAIPLGVSLGLTPLVATLTSIIGNLLPILPLLLLLEKIFAYLKTRSFSKKFITKMEQKVDKKRPIVDKYGWFGLITLVAIPLPGTGAWTGALVAVALKMRIRFAFLAITTGVLISALIVFLITYGFTALL